MTDSLFLACARQLLVDDKYRSQECKDQLPVTCIKFLDNVVKNTKVIKNRLKGHVDFEGTLKKLKSKIDALKILHIRLALGYELSDTLWASVPVETLRGIANDAEQRRGVPYLSSFWIQDCYKRKNNETWGDEVKGKRLEEAFKECCKKDRGIAACRLFLNAANTQEKAKVACLAWFLCATEQTTPDMLRKIFYYSSQDPHVMNGLVEDLFDETMGEIWNLEKLTLPVFQTAIAMVPEEINVQIVSVGKFAILDWANTKLIHLMFMEDDREAEERERLMERERRAREAERQRQEAEREAQRLREYREQGREIREERERLRNEMEQAAEEGFDFEAIFNV
ncbi:hypothetical protein L596_024991 [Steinernema carpocapsae]|uniref:Uncharacterized protein n=1 Tax=Steinernema carpocapsae TaxID=34508 RepID=A0A4V6XVR5_STECR|nr:hypothetical protein L596_024991 [Steinernema carpocapsae]